MPPKNHTTGNSNRRRGLKMLLKKGREKFRIAENRLYYSEADFKAAERKFLIECIINGRCRM
jgi:hypothetical protein